MPSKYLQKEHFPAIEWQLLLCAAATCVFSVLVSACWTTFERVSIKTWGNRNRQSYSITSD